MMADEADKQDSGTRAQIIVAVIGLIGVVATALFANWDRIFPAGRQEGTGSLESRPPDAVRQESAIDQEKRDEAGKAPSPDTAAVPTGGEQLLAALKDANIGFSVERATIIDWLNASDRTYLRIAQGCLDVLDGRRIRNRPIDIDVIAYRYLQRAGLNADAPMPASHVVDTAILKAAMVDAYKDKNGAGVRSFDDITASR